MTTDTPSTTVPGDGQIRDLPYDEPSLPTRRDDADARGERSEQWTPEPEPQTFAAFTDWGSKHFGEDWKNARDKMMNDVYNTVGARCPENSKEYRDRQQALRVMENRLQGNKLELPGRELSELHSLARKRYGEAWYLNRRACMREIERREETEDVVQRWNHTLRARKRARMAEKIRKNTDGTMLSKGYTWAEILDSSRGLDDINNTITSTPTMSDVGRERSGSSDWSGSIESSASSVPSWGSETMQEARTGPEADTLEKLEWEATVLNLTEERYEAGRWKIMNAARSKVEDQECVSRCAAEGPEARQRREEMQDRFFREQYLAVERIMKEERCSRWLADSILNERCGGDWCKLPQMGEIAPTETRSPGAAEGSEASSPVPLPIETRRPPGGGRPGSRAPRRVDPGILSEHGRASRPRRQRKAFSGSPQGERRQSRRIREEVPEYERLSDPEKLLRSARALARGRL